MFWILVLFFLRASVEENEFWPCLLEKAVAKLVQAYYRLDGGFEQIALEMLLHSSLKGNQ